MSTPYVLISRWAYPFRTEAKCFPIADSLPKSRPVSRGVPASEATRVSVGGCDVPRDILEMAQSTISTPASAALKYAMEAMPLV